MRAAIAMALAALAAAAQAGQTGADYLRMEVPPRQAGMAGAWVAGWDDPAAFLWNPAALGRLPGGRLQVNHMAGVLDTNYEQGALALPASPLLPGGVGLMAQYSSTGNFSETDAEGRDKGSVANYDLVTQAAWGLPLTRRVSAGASFKYFTSKLQQYSNSGQAVDLGLQSAITDRVDMGLALLHLGSQTAFDREADPLPTLLKLGVQALVLETRESAASLALEVDRAWNAQESMQARLGAEYWYQRALALRAGYVFGADVGNLTVGLGCRLFGVRVDYAYVPFNELGFAHRLGVSLEFDTLARSLGVDQAAPPALKPAARPQARPTAQRTPAAAAAVQGSLRADTLWRRQDSPVVVSGDLVVPKGVTLSVEPGVEVRFRRREQLAPVPEAAAAAVRGQEGDADLVVLGRLAAVGTLEQPIVFDGEAGPGWGAIVFEGGSDPLSRLERVRVDGGRVVVNASSPTLTKSQLVNAPIELGVMASPEISYCTLQEAEVALTSWSETATLMGVHHNLFTRNKYAVYLKDVGSAVLRMNTFLGNTAYDILNASPKPVDARLNAWGTADPQAIARRVFDRQSHALCGPVAVTPVAR